MKKEPKIVINIILGLFSAFLLKGVHLIIAPIITRMLSQSEYGYVVNYQLWFSLLSVFVGLQIGGSIQNALLEYKDERTRARYYSNAMMVGLFTSLFFCLIFALFNNSLSSVLDISPTLLYVLVLQMFGWYCIGFLSAKFVAEKKPLKNFIFVVFVIWPSALLSILFIVFAKDDPHFYYLFGNALPIIVAGIIVFLYFVIKGRTFYNKKLLIFALAFSLPLIVHVLSNILLVTIDRIMLRHMGGFEIVAIYSAAFALSQLLTVIWGAINSAYVPFYYEYLEKKETDKLVFSAKHIIFFVTIVCMGFMLTAPEVFKILFPEEYWSGIVLIPLFAADNFLRLLYTFSVNYEFYHKKTVWIAVGTLLAASVNIALNLALIPLYGMTGAAISSVVSFAMLFVFHEIISRKVIKAFPLSIKTYIFPIFSTALFVALCYLLQEFAIIRWLIASALCVVLVIKAIKTKNVVFAKKVHLESNRTPE